MPVSQFKVYSSSDGFAPQMDGTSGSLLSVLNACLVDGFGSKIPAGWLKPLADVGNIGVFQQPSGSGFVIHVNDAAPTSSTTYTIGHSRMVTVTGYESISSVSSGSTTAGYIDQGTGFGQFPLNGQTSISTYGLNIGALIWVKSISIDSTPRPWRMFVDDRTMYLFIQHGVSGASYTMYSFGDLYSLYQNDRYQCHIQGLNAANSGIWNRSDASDLLVTNQNSFVSFPDTFLARTWGGGGQSINAFKTGDVGKCYHLSRTNYSGNGVNNTLATMYGPVPYVNSTDQSVYIHPVLMFESANFTYRGRMRGMWHITHRYENFSDGQVIYGTNEVAGKTWQVIANGTTNGVWLIETSNTVETN